ncbi:MAG: M20 family metallo-hydrolase [Thermodesulfobacteriota bacterium]|nr:M20 family metallo-hydrolase [Thermodesulfobacteriota bacterium]
MDAKVFKRIANRIDSYKDDMVRMQIGLTAIPALAPDNGGDGEYEKAKFLIEYLYDLGFSDIREYNAPDVRVSSGIRPNIITTIPGGNRKKPVWVLTHIDIVPPGELNLWESDPYKGYVKDGKIYGRGTEDNQQDMVASIFAAKAFIEEGITPENGAGLAFVADEETASKFGLEYLLKNEKNLFRKTDILVVPDFGNEEGTMIEVAEKSMLWLRFKTTGKQCHASRPSLGKNAFLAASHLVVRLNDLHHTFGASDPLYQPPTSTFEPTRKDANIPNINTIPGEDIFYVDSRVLPQYRVPDVISEMRKMAGEIEEKFGVSIEITPIQQAQAPPPTPHDAPVVTSLQKAISDVYGVNASPVGIGGGTVAAFFRREGYPVAVWSRFGQTAHQPNENCAISNMIGNAKVFAHMFLQK